MMASKKSLLIYYSYKDQFDLLSDEELGQLLRAAMAYEMEQVEPQDLPRHLMMAFTIIRRDLDRNREAYAERCEKSRQAIQQRWNKADEGVDSDKDDTNAHEHIPNDTNVYERIRTYDKKNEHIFNDTKNTDKDEDEDKDKDEEKDKNNLAQPHAVERVKKEPKKSTDADFDYFWTLYPKRVAKQDARKAFEQALKKASPGDIFVGAKKFSDWCKRNAREQQYIPYPAKWLRAGGWDDELMDSPSISFREKERKACTEYDYLHKQWLEK